MTTSPLVVGGFPLIRWRLESCGLASQPRPIVPTVDGTGLPSFATNWA
jgi:hypothetical protein